MAIRSRSRDAVVDFLPRVLPHIVDEQPSGRLERERERIAKAERPDRAVHARCCVEEWVVGRDRSIRVEAQHLTQEVAQRLCVGRVRVLTDRDVELSVQTKVDRAAIVVGGGAQVFNSRITVSLPSTATSPFAVKRLTRL